MDLKALLLIQGVIVATCLSTFVAARQLAPEPSASSSSASSSSSSLCSRALATTLWGAAFAFFSLMADAGPASKAYDSFSSEGSFRFRWAFRSGIFFALGPVAPLIGIVLILRQMFTTLRFRQTLKSPTNLGLGPDTMSKSTKLRRVIDDVLAILFGINQPPGFLQSTRIVANTYMVLLTLGHKTAENSCLMELNEAGKLALLESSILPNYKQLRFVDGRSGIATLILAVQAIGYVTSIVYRAIHHWPVSPIEAIGFTFSMLIIVHSVVHSVGVMCQNPLVIYLNPTQEQKMLDQCESTRWSYVDGVICATMVGTVAVGSVVVAFTILVEWHVLRISWLDTIGPILFLISLITQLFSLALFSRYLDLSRWGALLFLGSFMISFGGIVVSIVAT